MTICLTTYSHGGRGSIVNEEPLAPRRSDFSLPIEARGGSLPGGRLTHKKRTGRGVSERRSPSTRRVPPGQVVTSKTHMASVPLDGHRGPQSWEFHFERGA
jgi:hypothetical protein